MSWFGKRRNKKIHLHNVSIPGLIRQSIYDTMLNDPRDIAMAMGLPPISEEVSEMEERASDERIGRISALIPFISSHSDITANIVSSAYILDSDKIEEVSSEELDELIKLFKMVALSATVSGISTLVDLGLIELKVSNDDE